MKFNRFQALLPRWFQKPQSATVTRTYRSDTDVTVERLRVLQQEHAQETRRLAQQLPIWDRLTGRTDPEADIEKRALAPEIVDRKQLVGRLSDEIAQAQEHIRITRVTAADYERRANDIRPWVDGLIEGLPSDADLERAFAESRYFDRTADDLLRRTGDRRAFRRPIIDPYRALREALEDRLRVIERLRLLRSVAPLDKKAAS